MSYNITYVKCKIKLRGVKGVLNLWSVNGKPRKMQPRMQVRNVLYTCYIEERDNSSKQTLKKHCFVTSIKMCSQATHHGSDSCLAGLLHYRS